jgi:hypothetical protein
MMPIDHIPAYVQFFAQSQYEVAFYINKPRRVRSTQIVSANSSSDAKALIIAQYGKDNVSIISTKKVERK